MRLLGTLDSEDSRLLRVLYSIVLPISLLANINLVDQIFGLTMQGMTEQYYIWQLLTSCLYDSNLMTLSIQMCIVHNLARSVNQVWPPYYFLSLLCAVALFTSTTIFSFELGLS